MTFVKLVILLVSLAIALPQFASFSDSPQAAEAQTGISFVSSVLQGTVDLNNPTSLQFGPDGRLYVSQQDGIIWAYTIVRNGPTDYVVTDIEEIDLIQNMPNYDDDGTPNSDWTTRQVTGIYVTGDTSNNPVIYVTSSDPRIAVAEDSGLDTNSGILSRLTWNGSNWEKLDLVRGMPRSEENHSQNGLVLDETNNILYVTSGGNTNMGAPSNNFALTPEYALSAAILSIDLDAIGETTYDIPTLDDPTRTNIAPGVDENDPFGGNDGANQAKIVPGGPVQVHSGGWRNVYDVIINSAGRLYTIDNGPNGGWGGPPIGEGTPNCTNDPNEADSASNKDNLHYISAPGYYGGHPTPARGNPQGIFGTEADSPVPFSMADPNECDYRKPGVDDGALVTYSFSTNGFDEYTATNFSGAMTGDLLATSWDNKIWRVKLNDDGDAVVPIGGEPKVTLFDGFGSIPLDLVAQGDTDIFAGTVWVAVFGDDKIQVFEPVDFQCFGTDNPLIDEDGDGYDNADEIDAGSDPCSAGSTPSDFDKDFISDVNDPDDDNDTILDVNDAFAIDAENGLTTEIPLLNDLFNADTGFFGVGFTGLMVNGSTDYLNQFDPDKMTVGGAAGRATVDEVSSGDALGTFNDQDYGFQFGINVDQSTGPYLVRTRIEAPFFDDGDPDPPEDFKSHGVFIGTGDQSNYVKVALTANGGVGGLEVVQEDNDVFSTQNFAPGGLLSAINIDFFFYVDPVAGTVQPQYAVNGGPISNLGSPLTLTGDLLNVVQGSQALAVGIISTSRNADPFIATWDVFEIKPLQPGVLKALPNPVNFNTISPGSSTSETITLYNLGQAGDPDITISELNLTGDPAVSISSAPTLPYVLAPDSNVEIEVTYAPATPNVASAFLEVVHNGSNPAVMVELNGSTINDPIYRVNAGGSQIAGTPIVWEADNPQSSYVNTGNTYGSGGFTGLNDTGAPSELFGSERWDGSSSPEMQWNFPVDDGTYEVRLYFAEIFFQNPGSRVFDVEIEGALALDNYDAVAEVGYQVADMQSFETSVTDGNLTIEFIHQTENPAIKGIEIIPISISAGTTLAASPSPLDFGAVEVGLSGNEAVTLTHTGTPGSPDIIISDVTFAGADAAMFSDDFAGPVTLSEGESTSFNATFTPSSGGAKSATMEVAHTGDNAPLLVNITASGFVPGQAEALFEIVPPGGINASTYNSGSFKITNNSPESQQITKVTIDLSTAVFPDMVFDPDGLAGDVVAKCFVADSGSSATGFNAPADNCSDPFAGPHDDGYDIIELTFNDFDPTEQFTFSVDVDPTSIRGTEVPGPNESGSVSGLELVGTQITVEFDGGATVLVADTYRVPSSVSGSENIVRADAPTAPTIEVVGLPSTPAVVANPNQTIRVNGPDGANVALLVVEGGLFEDDPPGLFDPDPFEANSALVVDEYFDTISGSFVDIPVTLTDSDPDGGLNYIVAVVQGTGGHNSDNSNLVILEYDADATAAALAASPDPVDFGGVDVGTPATETVTLTHTGVAGDPDIVVSDVAISGDDAADFSHNFSGPVTLTPGNSTTVDVTFTPSSFGAKVASMDITHDGSNSPLAVELLGTGVASQTLEISPDPLNFGQVELGNVSTLPLTLTNLGGGGDPAIDVTDVVISSDYDNEFSHSFTDTISIAAGDSATLDVTFTPALLGSKSVLLTVTHNGINSPMSISLLGEAIEATTVVYRVNAGGPVVTGDPVDWSEDTTANPSSYVNAIETGNQTYTAGTFTGTNTTSAPNAIFSHERWDPPSSPEMTWEFPVDAGEYDVRLFFAETFSGNAAPGARVFDIVIEGELVLDNYDIFADVGFNTAVMQVFVADVSDGSLTVELLHEVENPAIKGIEIIEVTPGGGENPVVGITPDPVNFGAVPTMATEAVTLTNEGNPSDLAVDVTAVNITGTDAAEFSHNFSGPVTLNPADTTTVDVTFTRATPGAKSAFLQVTHTGANSPTSVELVVLSDQVELGPVFRVNVGGPLVSDTPLDWSEDSAANPSPYLNADNNTSTYSPGAFGGTNNTGAPDSLFSTERYDFSSAPNMIWTFPVGSGSYEVNLYFAETYFPLSDPGDRVFDVTVEGVVELDDYDVGAQVGYATAIMESIPVVVTDGDIVIEFLHVVENPNVKAIEIVQLADEPVSTLAAAPNPVDFGQVDVTATETVTLTNEGNVGDPDIEITAVNVSGPDAAEFSHDFSGPVTLIPGNSITVDVTFTPVTEGLKSAMLDITHTGVNTPLSVELAGSHGETFDSGVLYRVNAGGPQITDTPIPWGQDTAANPSAYVNAYAIGNQTYNPGVFGGTNATAAPNGLFAAERWDPSSGPEMLWEFPVDPGIYDVNLYFAEIFGLLGDPGDRVFDVTIEGELVLDNYDISADVGFNVAVLKSFQVAVDDGAVTIEFLHEVENPAIKGLEIVGVSPLPEAELVAAPSSLDLGTIQVGATATETITLTHSGSSGDPNIEITSVTLSGADAAEFGHNFTAPVTLIPGDSTTVDVDFIPVTAGAKAAALEITHSGDNSPVTVNLSGEAYETPELVAAPAPLAFGATPVGTPLTEVLTLTNNGGAGAPDIEITAVNVNGADAAEFGHDFTVPVLVTTTTPATLSVTFDPATAGVKLATLEIAHTGDNTPLLVDLSGEGVPVGDPEAFISVLPTGDINAATETAQAFTVTNNSAGGQKITGASIYIQSSVLPDLAFDPLGIAGDTQAKCATIDAGSTETGSWVPGGGTLCEYPIFVGDYEDGYRGLQLFFTDFEPGESVSFSVDVDPISIRGSAAPGPSNAGNISGLELTGALVAVQFSDDTLLWSQLYHTPGSESGSQAIVRADTPAPPWIGVLGEASLTTVGDANQTVRVAGPEGAEVSLLVMEGALYEPAGGGYKVDPFEANTAVAVTEYTGAISGGYVDIPITLTKSVAEGGLNTMTAVVKEADGRTSYRSNTVILEYDPSLLTPTIVEAEDAQVARIGTWIAQKSRLASNQLYLYNNGGSDDVLEMTFEGTSVEVFYIQHYSLGTMAIEVDGVVLLTVDTSGATAFMQSAMVDYLTPGTHQLRVYAVGDGTIAVDAFAIRN